MDKDDLLLLGICAGVGAAIGALTGLGLSFTALSPLIMGGIVAAIPMTLLCVLWLCICAQDRKFSKRDFFFAASVFVASAAAIGVGLAAAATAIFPGAMLGVGAAIGAIAPIAGIFATYCIIAPIAEKVNEYIISPIVNKVSECCSSKEDKNIVQPTR